MAITNIVTELSLRDVLNTIFRHKWKIVVITLAIALGVTVYTWVVPELYRSESKMMVRLGRSVAIDPAVVGPSMAMITNRDADVKSEMAILQNRDLFEQVVAQIGEDSFLLRPDELTTEGGLMERLRVFRRVSRGLAQAAEEILIGLDLKTRLSKHDKAIKKAMENLKVEVERNTTTLLVSYEAPGAELAKNTLDYILRFYLDRHIQVHASEATPDFFENQTAKLLEEMTRSEQELNEFKTKNGLSSIETQKGAMLERINSLDGEAANVAAKRDGSKARLAVLEEALKKNTPTHELTRIVRNVNPVVDNLRQLLVDLRNQETELASRYPETYRPLEQLRQQIKQTEEVVNQQEKTRTEVTTGINSAYTDLYIAVAQERSELESGVAAYKLLSEELAKAKEEFAKLAAFEVELNRLSRNLEVAEKEYKEYRDNLSRSQISYALDQAKVSNISVIQAPTLPLGPSRPNKPLNMALGLMLGLFAGVSIAFLLDYLDDTLRTKEKVERRLGVPVLTILTEKEISGCT
jgi:uncharacterized protein involved in exopolysaccharide biosynthesis